MLNVDKWLDTIEPRQFDEWLAFRRLEPDPDERLREILKMGLASLLHAWGVKIEPHMLDPVSQKPEASVQHVSSEHALGMLRSAYGS